MRTRVNRDLLRSKRDLLGEEGLLTPKKGLKSRNKTWGRDGGVGVEEEQEEEEDLFVFNDRETIEGPRAPVFKPGRMSRYRSSTTERDEPRSAHVSSS
jgi:hypothetical protein